MLYWLYTLLDISLKSSRPESLLLFHGSANFASMHWKLHAVIITFHWASAGGRLRRWMPVHVLCGCKLVCEQQNFFGWVANIVRYNISGLVQGCSNSSALAMELLQSCKLGCKLQNFWGWVANIVRCKINDLVQDCSYSSALAMEFLQSCKLRCELQNFCGWAANIVRCKIIGIVQDSSNSSASPMELLQSCNKLSK